LSPDIKKRKYETQFKNNVWQFRWKVSSVIKPVIICLHQLLGGIYSSEIISHMCPNFSREGWLAGYLGHCPKFDQIFFLMASLTPSWRKASEGKKIPLIVDMYFYDS
jgi:hypothetical protein